MHRFTPVRWLAAIATLIFVAIATLIASPANAAYVTTDYVWSSWVRCSFGPSPFTYENVRWRIDYQHVNGQRSARAITYVDISGSTVVDLEHEVETWHSSGNAISSGSSQTRNINASTTDWYVGQNNSWASMASAVDLHVALTLSDGNTCTVTHSY